MITHKTWVIIISAGIYYKIYSPFILSIAAGLSAGIFCQQLCMAARFCSGIEQITAQRHAIRKQCECALKKLTHATTLRSAAWHNYHQLEATEEQAWMQWCGALGSTTLEEHAKMKYKDIRVEYNAALAYALNADSEYQIAIENYKKCMSKSSKYNTRCII